MNMVQFGQFYYNRLHKRRSVNEYDLIAIIIIIIIL